MYYSLQTRHQLTPVQLSFSLVDGTMQKTPEVTLMKHLESAVTSTPSPSINNTIIDALFFIHWRTSSSLPESFGVVAYSLLQKVMYAEGDVIHLVTDKWMSPSIIDCERDLRRCHHQLPLILLVHLRNARAFRIKP